MTIVSQSAHMLAEASGGAVLVLAHHGKQAARGIRGHSAVEDQADAILTTLRTRNAPRVTVRVDKNRDGATGQWQRYDALTVAGSLALDHVASGEGVPDVEDHELDRADEHDDEAAPIPERLLSALAEHDRAVGRADLLATLAESGLKVPPATFVRHMSDLVAEGVVTKAGDRKTTRYALAEGSK